jgi:shikimate dehydrogenase
MAERSVSPELYAVFGDPIVHSLSPRMHRAAFLARGWDHCHYFPIETPRASLAAQLEAFRAIGGRGANLTRPLKEEILATGLLADCDGWAAHAGAVNTVVWRDGAWHGANTDAPALRAAVTARGAPVLRVLILGAGGVARASWEALFPAAVTVASRRPAGLPPQVTWVSWESGVAGAGDFDVVVNATPLGQEGEEGWQELPRLRQGQGVVEWVYKPLVTPLVHEARRRGAWVVDGLELLARQAALAWVPWFDEEGPWELMRAAVP